MTIVDWRLNLRFRIESSPVSINRCVRTTRLLAPLTLALAIGKIESICEQFIRWTSTLFPDDSVDRGSPLVWIVLILALLFVFRWFWFWFTGCSGFPAVFKQIAMLWRPLQFEQLAPKHLLVWWSSLKHFLQASSSVRIFICLSCVAMGTISCSKILWNY